MSDDGAREVKFKQEHYDLLVMCAEKGDMTEWNAWQNRYHSKHKETGDAGVYLEGADLRGKCLDGVCLSWAHLEGAKMEEAHLKNAHLTCAHLEKASLMQAHLEEATMDGANMNGAHLEGAHLERAKMGATWLVGASLFQTHLEGAILKEAHLEDAEMSGCYIDGTSFYDACFNNKTHIMGCNFNIDTDFSASAISSTRIDPRILTLIQRNIRRKYWIKWYDQHVNLQYPVRLFWWLSDYGTTCSRCIGAFVLLIIAAFITYFWITGIAISSSPELFADTILATFGFGSLFDQCRLTGPVRLLLAAHVLAGYFLLAVLITRFAVMFQSLTP